MIAECDWEHYPEPKDDRGRMRNTCRRCGREIWQPYHPSEWKGSPVWCRENLRPHELGHWLTLILEACWIRKEDYLWLKTKLWMTPKCGCDKREAALNTWGDRVLGWLKKKPDPDQEARP